MDYNKNKFTASDPLAFLDVFFKTPNWNKFEDTVKTTITNTLKGLSLTRSGDNLIATLEVPGVAKDDIKVEFSELENGFSRLTITTLRNDVEGSFKSEFREKVDASKAQATLELGVLTVTVPVKNEEKKNTTEVPIS